MIYNSFLEKVRIPPRPTFENWCEENIYLSTKFAAKAGPFSLELTPYMKFIYECLNHDSEIKEITLMMGSQLGKTQMNLNYMLFRQDIAPGPMMYIMPTIKNALVFSRERAGPMFDATKVIRMKIDQASVKGKAISQTMAIKNLPGGFVMFVGSNSASDLTSTPVRDILFDEMDRYAKDVAGEGSPVKLAMKRTTTFHNSVVLKTSTPTIRDDSFVEDSFQHSTKFYYYVPCPLCTSYQILEIENLRESGYLCGICEKIINDGEYKREMLAKGEWRTRDEKTNHYGFHLSQLYAPYMFVKWKNLYKERMEALNDVEKLKVFCNTVLAITYQEAGESANWKTVRDRTTRDYRLKVVWPETIAITMAVDCQMDHLVYEVRGWKENMVSYSLCKGVVVGAIGEGSAQKALEELVNDVYLDEFEQEHKVDKVLIDSSYDTVDVYSFCRLFSRSLVSPIKGVDELNYPISLPIRVVLRKSGKKFSQAGLFFYKIGTSLLKKRIYSIFNLNDNDYENDQTWRRVFFPKSYEKEWFEQLCAERLITVRNKITNQSKKVWKKVRERNEALDLAVYNLAAAHLLQIDDPNYAKKKMKAQVKKPKSRKKRSSLEIGL